MMKYGIGWSDKGDISAELMLLQLRCAELETQIAALRKENIRLWQWLAAR